MKFWQLGKVPTVIIFTLTRLYLTLQVHVDIDHPLIDISLDVFCNLWAVCNDGSAYFRMGICDDNPTGNYLII